MNPFGQQSSLRLEKLQFLYRSFLICPLIRRRAITGCEEQSNLCEQIRKDLYTLVSREKKGLLYFDLSTLAIFDEVRDA